MGLVLSLVITIPPMLALLYTNVVLPVAVIFLRIVMVIASLLPSFVAVRVNVSTPPTDACVIVAVVELNLPNEPLLSKP